MAFPSIPSIPSIPKPISKSIKYFIFGIFILNIKSLPFAYTLRCLPIASRLQIRKYTNYKNENKDLFKTFERSHFVFVDDVKSKNNSDNTNNNKNNINVHTVGISKLVFKEKNGKTIIPEQFFDKFGFKCETEESKIKREEIRKKGWQFIEGLFEFEKLIDYCEDKDKDDDYLENEKFISKL
ncbi:hypothetical protein Glove_21g251 [Diversispora epigaea]|uniref:Uncharacterized protein n=1 Tax=Diversispora epigaea TaxID=1348612 RepID=A0A397JPP9_9GLOM|nr:hypothetical protein Glove_21g251 [Diversispora epigaea]